MRALTRIRLGNTGIITLSWIIRTNDEGVDWNRTELHWHDNVGLDCVEAMVVVAIDNPAAEGSNRDSGGSGWWSDCGLSRTEREVAAIGGSTTET